MDKRALVLGLLADVGLPAVAYYGGRALGLDVEVALAAGGGVGLIRLAWIGVTRRRLDGLAAVVVGAFAALLVASLLTGDPRILLARESIVSGGLGLLLLGSAAVRRPVLYAMLRRLNAGNADLLARWDVTWRDRPAFRRVFLLMSVVWGAGLLAEAIIRVPLIYLLPVDVTAALSTALQVGTVGLLVLWSLWYRRRRQHAAAATASGAEGRPTAAAPAYAGRDGHA
ncbi:MAG TPA: VC0807 family protein [Actinocatenispora sp.]